MIKVSSMIKVSVSGNSTVIGKFHSALVTEFGSQNVRAEMPDCVRFDGKVQKITALFYVNSTFFDKEILKRPAFRNLAITVFVNNNLQIRKDKRCQIETMVFTAMDGRTPRHSKYDEYSDEEDVDTELSEFEDLEAYSERVRGYYLV